MESLGKSISLKKWRVCVIKDIAIIKTLVNEQYQIFIKHLQSDQCADSHINLTNYFKNCKTNLLKLA